MFFDFDQRWVLEQGRFEWLWYLFSVLLVIGLVTNEMVSLQSIESSAILISITIKVLINAPSKMILHID